MSMYCKNINLLKLACPINMLGLFVYELHSHVIYFFCLSSLFHLDRLPKLEKPNQEEPVVNQASADVIIEEIVEHQDHGGSGVVIVVCLFVLNTCMRLIKSILSIFTSMFGVV